jgi:hypothetical protein
VPRATVNLAVINARFDILCKRSYEGYTLYDRYPLYLLLMDAATDNRDELVGNISPLSISELEIFLIRSYQLLFRWPQLNNTLKMCLLSREAMKDMTT